MMLRIIEREIDSDRESVTHLSGFRRFSGWFQFNGIDSFFRHNGNVTISTVVVT